MDAFGDDHIRALCEAAGGRAVCDRLGQDASAAEYARAMDAAEVMVGWPDPDLLAASPLRLLLLPSAGYEEYLTPELAARAGLAGRNAGAASEEAAPSHNPAARNTADAHPETTAPSHNPAARNTGDAHPEGVAAGHDLVVCNAGGAYSEGVAEHCVAMMLALVRRLPEYLAAMPGRSWDHLHLHRRLAGATVCVIGLGTLGSAIAWRCSALGMHVVGVRRHPERPCPNVSAVFGPQDLAAAVAGADHVVGALPGGAATRGLISREAISAMKPGACFYNVGRGPSVDEEALIERLASGSLAGAGLDVFATEPLPDDSPLWAMDNVIVTPHMAGYTWDYADELCAVFAANLAAYVAGEPPPNVIDLSGAAS